MFASPGKADTTDGTSVASLTTEPLNGARAGVCPAVSRNNCFLRHPVHRLAAAIPTAVWAKPGRPAPRFLATGRRSRAVGIARPGIRDGSGHRQPAAGHGEVQDRDVAMSRRGYGVKPGVSRGGGGLGAADAATAAERSRAYLPPFERSETNTTYERPSSSMTLICHTPGGRFLVSRLKM